MNISPLEEYGLRCALQLARLEPGQHLSASRIAQAEGISVEYVSKIMFLFRKDSLVEAVRGIKGGFKLNGTPEGISLKRVFDALPGSGQNEREFCGHYTGGAVRCVHTNGCSMRPFWAVFFGLFQELSSVLTLSDLLSSETDVKQKLYTAVTTPRPQLKTTIMAGSHL